MNKLNEKEIDINGNSEYNDSMDECGYKHSKFHCENCNKYFDGISGPKIFKSFYLKSENNKLNLSKRIENCCKSLCKDNKDIVRCCSSPKIIVIDEIISPPKYLFICFGRVEASIENNIEIILNTQSGRKHYFLQSLLNHATIKNRNGQTEDNFSVTNFGSKSFPKSKNVSKSIIALMMVRDDENILTTNSEKSFQVCRKDMTTDLHKFDDVVNYETCIAEEKLNSDFIAESIKKIIESDKYNTIVALLGFLFSCTLFRIFMIDLYKNNEIMKVFEKLAFIDTGKFIKNVCVLYDHVNEQNRISSTIKSDNNWSIHQCFNYIFGSIKLITESKEFSEIFKSSNASCSNFICDNFYGTFLLEVFCVKCSDKKIFEDSFCNLCVNKPQNGSLVNLEKCLIDFVFERNYQYEEKCCKNAEFVLTRKIIRAPLILFICFNEKIRNNNQNCILFCDSILTIDTSTGPVAYTLFSLVDQRAPDIYDVKFLGNSDWWQTYPRPTKIKDTSELFTKFTVGFLFKKLE